jgi:hypothetical protein
MNIQKNPGVLVDCSGSSIVSRFLSSEPIWINEIPDVKRLDAPSVHLFIFSPMKIPTLRQAQNTALFLFPVSLENEEDCSFNSMLNVGMNIFS